LGDRGAHLTLSVGERSWKGFRASHQEMMLQRSSVCKFYLKKTVPEIYTQLTLNSELSGK